MVQKRKARIPVFLLGTICGVAALYFLDPKHGRGRRARAKEKAHSLRVRARHRMNQRAHDLYNRGRGIAAVARRAVRATPTEVVADDVTTARVRSCLGRVVSRPRAIEVEVIEGTVAMSGDVLSHELASLLRAVQKIRGVRAIENYLSVKEAPRESTKAATV